MDPSLQPSSLAEGLQGGPRPPPVAIGAIMKRCGWGTHATPVMEAARGVRPMMVLTGEAYDGPHPGGGREGGGRARARVEVVLEDVAPEDGVPERRMFLKGGWKAWQGLNTNPTSTRPELHFEDLQRHPGASSPKASAGRPRQNPPKSPRGYRKTSGAVDGLRRPPKAPKSSEGGPQPAEPSPCEGGGREGGEEGEEEGGGGAGRGGT